MTFRGRGRAAARSRRRADPARGARALTVLVLAALAFAGLGASALQALAAPHHPVDVTARDQESGAGRPSAVSEFDSVSHLPGAFHPHPMITCTPNAYVREQQAPGMHYYWLRNPHWLRKRDDGCVRTNQRTSFRITATPQRGAAVTMYPDEIWGCEWGRCTPHSQLPIRVRNVRSLNTLWWNKRTPHVGGMYNIAYDIWLTRKRYTNGRHNGVELMIWLRHHGGCCWTEGTVGFPTVQGIHYRLMTRFMSDSVHHAHWRFIEFRMTHQLFRISGLNLALILRRCEQLGYVQPSEWLESVGAGYEIWDGGVHLATDRFAVHMNGG